MNQTPLEKGPSVQAQREKQEEGSINARTRSGFLNCCPGTEESYCRGLSGYCWEDWRSQRSELPCTSRNGGRQGAQPLDPQWRSHGILIARCPAPCEKQAPRPISSISNHITHESGLCKGQRPWSSCELKDFKVEGTCHFANLKEVN